MTEAPARTMPSHSLSRASDETGPALTSITRPARRCLEAGPWWAPSRLTVVTCRLTDLASRGEQSVLSQARYCPAATACRISTEAKTSSQDLPSHGCLPVDTRSPFRGSQPKSSSIHSAFRCRCLSPGSTAPVNSTKADGENEGKGPRHDMFEDILPVAGGQ